jgi:hypothetical protein
MVINPYLRKDDEGQYKVSAYLETMAVVLNEDELEAKYAHIPLDEDDNEPQEDPFQ